MQSNFNAKTQRRKDAEEDGQNGSQVNAHHLVTRIGKSNFFFAPLRLCAFALKSSSLAAWIRLSGGLNQTRAPARDAWARGGTGFGVLRHHGQPGHGWIIEDRA